MTTPTSQSPLLGRSLELTALEERVRPGRLVTLVGLGGIGKTRLATAFADEASRTRPDAAVHFFDLSGARTADDLCADVARALGVRAVAGVRLSTLLGEHVSRWRDPLLVLDNLEQCDETTASVITEWLGAAPNAAFLATSRHPVDVGGEDVIALDALEVPALGEEDPVRIRESPAVQLFVDRALGRGFDARVLARAPHLLRDVARALEGIPLAIELAAARLDVLSLEEIAARLRARFGLLRDATAAPNRHAALWDAIDSSWQLLTPWQKSALAQAHVFEAPFDVASCEAVIDLPVSSARANGAGAFLASEPVSGGPTPLDALQALVRQSLVRSIPGDNGPRFALFDAVRDFAATRLDEVETAMVRERHAWHFLGRAEALAAEFEATGSIDALAALERDRDDVMAVLRRSLAATPADALTASRAATAVLALDAVMMRWSPLQQRALLEAVTKLVDALGGDELSRTSLDLACARAENLRWLGRLDEAAAAVAHAVPIARALGAAEIEGRLEEVSSHVHEKRGRYDEARASADRAILLFRSAQRRRREASALARRAAVDIEAEDFRAAVAHAEQSLAIAVDLGSRLDEAWAREWRAMAELESGALDRARVDFEQAAETFAALGERRNEAVARGYLGGFAHAEERWEDTLAIYEQARQAFEDVGDHRLAAVYEGYEGIVELERGDLDAAEPLLRRARAAIAEIGDVRYDAVMGAALAGLRALRGDVSGAERELDAVAAMLARGAAARVAPLVEVYRGVLDALRDDVASARRRADELGRVQLEDVSLAMPLLRRAIREAEQRARTWMFDVRRREIRCASGETIDLAARPALARIAFLLAERRVARPGEIVEKGPLVRAGWPDEEKLVASAASNRLKVAVSTLRKLGLEPIVVAARGGYMLDPSVPVEIA